MKKLCKIIKYFYSIIILKQINGQKGHSIFGVGVPAPHAPPYKYVTVTLENLSLFSLSKLFNKKRTSRFQSYNRQWDLLNLYTNL